MKRVPAVSLILANLIVAFLVVSQKWGYYYVILIYWCEAMIIGVYSLLRMTVSCWFGDPFGKWVGMKDGLSRLVLSIVLGGFFLVKFGGFALAMGLWVTLTPGILSDGASSGGFREVTEGLHAVGTSVAVAAALLFVSHGVSFIVNYIGRGEYRRSNVIVLLFGPYLRMMLVLGVLAVGFAATVVTPQLYRATGFAVGVVLLKLVVDLVSHSLEHRKPTGSVTNEAGSNAAADGLPDRA